MKWRSLFLLLLAMPVASFAQEFRGAIAGAITDPTGWLVGAAKVTVVETNTGAKFETTSDSSGHYTVPFLLPGNYDISVKIAGFKEFVRKGIHLGAGEQPVLDIRLEVGDTSVTVEVTADVPLINGENASIGQTITTKEVEDLPSNGGTPMMAASLTMGVINTSQPNTVQPFASAGAAGFSIAGSPSQTNELLIDGAPNTTWDGRLAYSPPRTPCRRFASKLSTDAGYGRTGAGTASQILKSGTNALKGTLYLAKVFDGRNKVFWFFAFEDDQASSPAPVFVTVPTDAAPRRLLGAAEDQNSHADLRSVQRHAQRLDRRAHRLPQQPDSFEPVERDRAKVSAVLSAAQHHGSGARGRLSEFRQQRHQQGRLHQTSLDAWISI